MARQRQGGSSGGRAGRYRPPGQVRDGHVSGRGPGQGEGLSCGGMSRGGAGQRQGIREKHLAAALFTPGTCGHGVLHAGATRVACESPGGMGRGICCEVVVCTGSWGCSYHKNAGGCQAGCRLRSREQGGGSERVKCWPGGALCNRMHGDTQRRRTRRAACAEQLRTNKAGGRRGPGGCRGATRHLRPVLRLSWADRLALAAEACRLELAYWGGWTGRVGRSSSQGASPPPLLLPSRPAACSWAARASPASGPAPGAAEATCRPCT